LAPKKNVHVYNRLGIALRKQNKWKEAIEEYRKALQVEPENETVFFNLGTAYLEGDKIEGNKKKDALQSFNKALDINPDFAEAKEALKNIELE
jgi:tetratricopeptide (TPR) repeat protein